MDHVCEAGDWKADCKYCLGLCSTSADEKDNFWDSFIIVLSGINKQESIFIGSDMNGHVGRDADGYGGVHGGMGFGERILDFGDAVGMVVCNTFF